MLVMHFGLKIESWIFGSLLFVVQVCCNICCFFIGIWSTQLSDFFTIMVHCSSYRVQSHF